MCSQKNSEELLSKRLKYVKKWKIVNSAKRVFVKLVVLNSLIMRSNYFLRAIFVFVYCIS